MLSPSEYSFVRYLAAKKTVDDRALNGPVWETLARCLPAGPLRVLEVGAGIGTMVERVRERGLLAQADYLALDEQAANVAAGRERLAGAAPQFRLDWQVGDLLEFAARPAQRGAWDLLIAHAVLDLLDLPTALPRLLKVLRPGGLFYFTLNFDGATLFQPELDPAFDAQIEALYHATMDARLTAGRRSGDSRTGRHLFEHLRRAGAEILAAGSSDWVVFASAGRYPADEAYFLRFILHTLAGALRDHPDLDAARFAAWVAARQAQIARGELVYIAHQLDFVGRRPAG
ncbi:MAG: class I SAM-dependent methyltransferase [Anaerolineales bacterium]|nr:class I SAM-dependent methyltransferase [Anaerolineales bacterium]